MALEFMGIDPDTQQQGSPTVWLDCGKEELVLQGWKPSAELEAECSTSTAPGHALGIPEHEQVIRIPFRMIPTLRKACDAAEGSDLH
ncbi:hypothetical protein [Streptacidiphilus anmyonensis]|uniref:hypothetical protein n=1 Tax=Streptacidiphilus anmyonensis TaxID=405782 RepID=UPI0005A7A30D|nr:hypothetical protein [Streptacidiphilus anmyonensis]